MIDQKARKLKMMYKTLLPADDTERLNVSNTKAEGDSTV